MFFCWTPLFWVIERKKFLYPNRCTEGLAPLAGLVKWLEASIFGYAIVLPIYLVWRNFECQVIVVMNHQHCFILVEEVVPNAHSKVSRGITFFLVLCITYWLTNNLAFGLIFQYLFGIVPYTKTPLWGLDLGANSPKRWIVCIVAFDMTV